MEGGTDIHRGHDPLFSGQSVLLNLPIYHLKIVHCSYTPIFNFRQILHNYTLIFGQNFNSQDTIFLNFRSQDPLFFKQNPLPRPFFWKSVRHIPRLPTQTKKKKKIDCLPRGKTWPFYWFPKAHFGILLDGFWVNMLQEKILLH